MTAVKPHLVTFGVRENQATDWPARCAALAFDCAGAGRGDEADLLRAAYRLVAALPHGFGPPRADALRFEGLLAADAGTDAALDLLDGRAGYMLSCGAGGGHMATVALAHCAGEASAEGASAALALIGALATALAEALGGDLRTGPSAPRAAARGAAARLN